MKMILIAMLAVGLVSGGASVGLAQDGRAGPAEVVSKVRKAVALFAEQGAAGLEVIRDNTSEFTWKDTYIFVVDCDADKVMANPAFPARVGGDIKQHTDYNGKRYGLELCETAKRPGGGWVEYVWPRPRGGKPSRKISYVMSVDGLPYQLGAGIYDDTVTFEELDRLISGAQ